MIYIECFGPLWAIFYFLMWFPWNYDDQIIIFIHFVLSICIFDTFLSLIIGLYMSLMSEMSDNIQVRYKLSFYSNITSFVAGIPVVLAQSLFDMSLQTFQVFNGILAIISMIIYLIVTRILKERPELRVESDHTFIQAIKVVLTSKAFLTRTGYQFFGNIARAIGFSFLFAYIIILGYGPLIPLLFMVITYSIRFVSQSLYIKFEKKWDLRKTIFTF